MRETAQPGDLLDWYDTHARDLPWRVSPADRAAGVRPDPYRIWLSEIMLQQTTVAAVKSYFERFTTLWPDVAALASAEDADVTLRLWQAFKPGLHRSRVTTVYETLERPLPRIPSDMELAGVKVEPQRLSRLSGQTKKVLKF